MEGPSASQQSNRKDAKLDASGVNRSYDIRIENFDISFGERLLSNFDEYVFICYQLEECIFCKIERIRNMLLYLLLIYN